MDCMRSKDAMNLPQALPPEARPRERLLRHGVGALTSSELLAIVLRTGTTGCNAVALGHQLVCQFNGLRGLLSASPDQLMAVRGLGAAKVCELLAVSELSRRSLREDMAARKSLRQPRLVKEYCASELAHLQVEHCIALYLTKHLRLLATERVSEGTLAETSVYPREIVKAALRHHAAAVILAHNHPSGDTTPSDDDLVITQRLKEALALIDVELIDHIIIGAQSATSLREQGSL